MLNFKERLRVKFEREVMVYSNFWITLLNLTSEKYYAVF